MTKLESNSKANENEDVSGKDEYDRIKNRKRRAEGYLMFVIPPLTIFSLEWHYGTFLGDEF